MLKNYFLVCFENVLLKRILEEREIDLDELETMKKELVEMFSSLPEEFIEKVSG